MNVRLRIAVLFAAACVGWTSAQQPSMPRTPWGTPDFQGGIWNFATMTPLERPRGIDKPELTPDETVTYERETAKARSANVKNGHDWWDEGSAHLDRRRTSLITDPPDGRLPPRVPTAERRASRGSPEDPEAFPLNTRCLFYQNAGPPMLPSPYNNNVQFVQTRDYVAILNENIHDVRIVPLDGRPHGTMAEWLGDSRGRWEGDTLVVDTINVTVKTRSPDPTRTCTSSNASPRWTPIRCRTSSPSTMRRCGHGRGRASCVCIGSIS